MKIFTHLFGGRGIRSFSFWLTLWGVVSAIMTLIFPFGVNASDLVSLFYLSTVFTPTALMVAFQLPSSTPDWVYPLFGPLSWYALGRFLDRLFLEKSNK